VHSGESWLVQADVSFSGITHGVKGVKGLKRERGMEEKRTEGGRSWRFKVEVMGRNK